MPEPSSWHDPSCLLVITAIAIEWVLALGLLAHARWCRGRDL